MISFLQKYSYKIIVYFIVFNLFCLFWSRFFNPIITFTQIGAYWEGYSLKRDYISYDEMGTAIKKAVIASEDQRFYQHWGFDMLAIKKAVKHNVRSKSVKGGSTISQQTAKNVFLWKGRTWFRKGLEALYTIGIELFWNKRIILERYLNVIEMGQGVFGIEAAAQYYFKKPAKNLSKSEAAWIAAVLPAPQIYNPKHPSLYLLKKHQWILNQMNDVSLE